MVINFSEDWYFKRLLYCCFYTSKGLSTKVLMKICVPKKPIKCILFIYVFVSRKLPPTDPTACCRCWTTTRWPLCTSSSRKTPCQPPALKVPARSTCPSYIKHWKTVLMFYSFSTFFILNQLIFSIVKTT